MLLPLRIDTIERPSRAWSYLTTERYRIDEHTLDAIATQCTEQSGALDTLLARVRAWIGTVLCNRRSAAPLRITRHLLDRARQYENARSRCGRYVEVLPEERVIIEHLANGVTASSRYKIVEIGLNGDGNVCKIALLLPFDQWLGNGTDRNLFLLIGCDGGLKTFYVVPGLKYRHKYRMDEGIEPLSFEQLAERAADEHKYQNHGGKRVGGGGAGAGDENENENDDEDEEEDEDTWTIVTRRSRVAS